MEAEEDEESEKSEYFYRLIHLVLDLGTEVLLELFKKDIPQGQTVEAFLNSKANVLKILKTKKVLNDLQLGILNATPPDVSRFDISLLYILISNLTNIDPPIGGWNQASPLPSDRSAGALLMNFRLVRNEAIAHWPKSTMKKSDFDMFWKRTEKCLVGLADEISQTEKDRVGEKIEEIKIKQLVEDQRCKLNTQIIGQLQEDIDLLKQKMEEQENNSGDVDTRKSSLEVLEVQLKDLENNMKKFDDISRKVDQQSDLSVDVDNMKTSIKNLEAKLQGLKSDISKFNDVTRKVDENTSRIHALENQSKSQEVQVTFPAEEKENDQMKPDLQKELVDHYLRNSYCKMSIAALIDDEQDDIKQLFVEPLMKRVKHDSFSNLSSDTNEEKDSKSTTLLEDIFREDGKSISRVCVSGNAGQGKTTLCQMIVSSWCKVHDNNEYVPDIYGQFLKPFEYVFYIPLRNNSISDVVEMIETDIVRKTSHRVLKEVLENESEKCLIILDGLDEWMPSEECKHKVPYIDPREKFTVLITSRPWKLETLRPKMSEIGQEVTLCAIDKNRIVERMVKLLNKKYGKDKNFDDFMFHGNRIIGVNEQYEKVKHLAEIPIILTQMVCMWYDDEEFGDTRVEIYSKMLDYLFHVAFKRDQERGKHTCTTLVKPQKSSNTKLINVFKGCSHCEEYSELLSKLSGLAFHALFNEEKEHSLVFLHSVTELYKLTENDVKFCLSVGILSQSKFSGKANSQLKRLSFIHKTVQEFLAAVFIAYGGVDTCFHSLLNTLISLDDVFEMSEVLIFLSGLKPYLLGDMSRRVAQVTDKDERVLQYRCSLWKNASLVGRYFNIIKACIDEVPKDKKMDCKVALHDYFACLNLDWEEKMIPYLDLEHVKSFWQKECFFWTELSGHDIVKLNVNINSQEHICHLTSIVERCVLPLECLSVAGSPSMNLVSLNDLFIALNKVCHLTCFHLSNLKLTHSDIDNLGGFLSLKTELSEIILEGIRCATCEVARCNYMIDLSHHKQLQYLKIMSLAGDIVLSDDVPLKHLYIIEVGWHLFIINRLKLSASLQELNVLDNCLMFIWNSMLHGDQEGDHSQLCLYKVLIDVIPTLKNLRKLSVGYIDFEQDIFKLSPYMTSLKFVNLFYCKLTLKCLQGFIDNLPQTQLNLRMFKVFIRPKDDLSTAVKYITDRCLVITSVVEPMKTINVGGGHTENNEDDSISLLFSSRPHQ